MVNKRLMSRDLAITITIVLGIGITILSSPMEIFAITEDGADGSASTSSPASLNLKEGMVISEDDSHYCPEHKASRG